MRRSCGFYTIALAFLTFLAISAPHSAYADPPDPCPPGNASDTTYNNNVIAYQQQVFTQAQNNISLFPMASANTCMQKVTSIFTALTSLSSGGGSGNAMNAAVQGILGSILNSICSQVVSSITSDLRSLTTICLPMAPASSLFNLTLPALPGCSGGTPISLMGNPSSSQSSGPYGYSQYMH